MVPVDEIDPASPEEFDRLVEDAVNRVLERRRQEGKALPDDQPPPGDGSDSES
jgi:hypothetical protein